MVAPFELVANPAPGHPVKREQHHGQRVRPRRRGAWTLPAGSRRLFLVPSMLIEEEDQVDGLGKLGPPGVLGIETEAAVLGIKLLGKLGDALGDQGLGSGVADGD